MEHVVVERSFEEPMRFDDLQAVEEAFAWCLEQNRVRFIRSYFSADRKRMICLYEAPDAEAVRNVNRQAGMPADRIYTVSVHSP